MILYHFCAAKHIKSILRQGLTKGALAEPTPTGFRIYYGYTWLTVDPDPNKQSWATRNAIKYDRTAWRLTIDMVFHLGTSRPEVLFAVAEALTEVIVDMGLGEAFKRYIENGMEGQGHE